MTILISVLCKVKVDTITNEDNSRKIQHPYREKTDKRVLKRNPWRDYGLHLTVLFLTIVAMYIGPIEITPTKGVTVSVMPLLYTMILGLICYLAKPIKWIQRKQSRIAEGAMMLFIGILIALPVALLLGFKRESIGLTNSIGREPEVAVVVDKYGFNSPEARGIFALFIVGTIIGTVFISFLTSISVSILPLHPFAFAMASGVGSASMNAASLGPTLAAFPGLETQIEAFAGFSNLLSFSVGIYIVMFLALPFTEKLYTILEPKIGRKDITKNEEE